MTRRRRPPVRLDAHERDALLDVARRAGLDHVGVCAAAAWTATRGRIESARAAGRSAGMEFTFRNPARSTDPTRVLAGARTMVVAARSYAQDVDDEHDEHDGTDGPGRSVGPSARVARYATADHYGRLRTSLEEVADALRARGARAVVVADDNSVVDREAAWRAGLGWYGKNSLLLVPGSGSWFVLGSVVTDAVVEAAPRPVADGCGTCDRCVTGCPTGAIVAPGVVDARRCLSWLLQAPGSLPVEFRAALGDRLYGCDDCQEVCPPNRTVELRSRRGAGWPVETEPGPCVDAVELLDLPDEELLGRCDRWYVAGRDPGIVRRNLLVVLGNSGTGDPGVIRRLERYRDGADPVLAEHATWALRRLAALAGGALTDED